MELLKKYFGDIDGENLEKLGELQAIYAFWNQQINVISRKDFENFQVNHLIHSLSIGKIIQFEPRTRILDVGTGGGFPGVPLAIMFPEVNFILVDSIGKKIKVVDEVVRELELSNVSTIHGRAEEVNGSFDFIVSRAVSTLPKFVMLVKKKIATENKNQLQNGILYLKGGDISEELAETKMKNKVYNLCNYFEEPFFETKKLVHLYS